MVKYYGFFNMKYLLWSTGNTISNFKVCFLFLIVIKFDTPELNNFEWNKLNHFLKMGKSKKWKLLFCAIQTHYVYACIILFLWRLYEIDS